MEWTAATHSQESGGQFVDTSAGRAGGGGGAIWLHKRRLIICISKAVVVTGDRQTIGGQSHIPRRVRCHYCYSYAGDEIGDIKWTGNPGIFRSSLSVMMSNHSIQSLGTGHIG